MSQQATKAYQVPRIALMGRLRAGKDFVADGTSFQKHRLAEPVYAIAKAFFGNQEKNAPGYRRLLQQIGQYGRAVVSEQYPLTPERAAFVHAVRQTGWHLFNFDKISWKNYGMTPDFWVRALLESAPTYNCNPRHSADLPVIVNDLRFPLDKKVLEEAGFKTYLVVCTEETRRERMEHLGEKHDGKLRSDFNSDAEWAAWVLSEDSTIDVSEQWATRWSNELLYPGSLFMQAEFPLDCVIWNDHRDPPPGSILHESTVWMTAKEFHERFKNVLEDSIREQSTKVLETHSRSC